MSEHVLIAPEGDVERRRHAHTECVAAAHARGELPTYDDWRATQPKGPSLLARLLRRTSDGPARCAATAPGTSVQEVWQPS